MKRKIGVFVMSKHIVSHFLKSDWFVFLFFLWVLRLSGNVRVLKQFSCWFYFSFYFFVCKLLSLVLITHHLDAFYALIGHSVVNQFCFVRHFSIFSQAILINVITTKGNLLWKENYQLFWCAHTRLRFFLFLCLSRTRYK